MLDEAKRCMMVKHPSVIESDPHVRKSVWVLVDL
jgi:hypothetical protein